MPEISAVQNPSMGISDREMMDEVYRRNGLSTTEQRIDYLCNRLNFSSCPHDGTPEENLQGLEYIFLEEEI